MFRIFGPRCLSRNEELQRCPSVSYCCAVWQGWWGAEQPSPAGGIRIYSDGNGLLSPCRNSYHRSFCLLPPRDNAEERLSNACLPFCPEPSLERRPGSQGRSEAQCWGLAWETESLGGAREEGAGVGETRGWLLPCASPVQLLPLPRLGFFEPPQQLRYCPQGASAPAPALAVEQGQPGGRGGWRSCFVELKKLLHHRAC